MNDISDLIDSNDPLSSRIFYTRKDNYLIDSNLDNKSEIRTDICSRILIGTTAYLMPMLFADRNNNYTYEPDQLQSEGYISNDIADRYLLPKAVFILLSILFPNDITYPFNYAEITIFDNTYKSNASIFMEVNDDIEVSYSFNEHLYDFVELTNCTKVGNKWIMNKNLQNSDKIEFKIENHLVDINLIEPYPYFINSYQVSDKIKMYDLVRQSSSTIINLEFNSIPSATCDWFGRLNNTEKMIIKNVKYDKNDGYYKVRVDDDTKPSELEVGVNYIELSNINQNDRFRLEVDSKITTKYNPTLDPDSDEFKPTSDIHPENYHSITTYNYFYIPTNYPYPDGLPNYLGVTFTLLDSNYREKSNFYESIVHLNQDGQLPKDRVRIPDNVYQKGYMIKSGTYSNPVYYKYNDLKPFEHISFNEYKVNEYFIKVKSVASYGILYSDGGISKPFYYDRLGYQKYVTFIEGCTKISDGLFRINDETLLNSFKTGNNFELEFVFNNYAEKP